MERTAQCYCGALLVIATGEPERVYLCHYLKNRVRLEGVRKIYERGADSGGAIRFHFCPNCGSNMYWEGDRNPAVCGVAVGAFDEQSFPPPGDSIWEESIYPLLGLPSEMEHHRRNRYPEAGDRAGGYEPENFSDARLIGSASQLAREAALPSPTKPFGPGPPSPAVRARGFVLSAS
jgi:hypothetical protein